MTRRISAPALLVLLAGCSDDPTSPALQAGVAGLLSAPFRLEVGEVRTFEAAAGATISLAARGGDEQYLYVPFFASDDGEATLALEITGGSVIAPTGPPNPSLAPSGALLSRSGTDGLTPDLAFHQRLREREIRELGPRLRAGGPALRRAALRDLKPSPQTAAAPPVGALLDSLNVNANEPCANPVYHTARVAAVSDRAIVAVDVANPPSGFTDAEYKVVAEAFDDLVYDLDVENFGEPTDIDENNRVILFYTRAVNELTPPNSDSFVGGFFFARDLFPSTAENPDNACLGSNESEILYLLAPDPGGVVNGNPRSEELIVQSTVGVTAHELQHLINASRRIYINDAEAFEEVWLNEGLSHIAEELLFYRVSQLQPRQNITVEKLRAANAIDAFNSYAISNFGRLFSYLTNPDTTSLLGVDNLPTRGASWAFLRYAADQDEGPDAPLWFELANGPRTGVANVTEALGVPALDLMQTWTVSVYTDDAGIPGIAPLYLQPSWHFRDIMSAISRNGTYPLAVRAFPAEGERTFDLLGGGAAFVRFGVVGGTRALIQTRSGGAVPPSGLRISIVRVR